MSKKIGFIGLGVMGEPMCRNLAQKCGFLVMGFDLNDEPFARLKSYGVERSEVVAIMAQCDVVFLSLPSGEVVHQLSHQPNGLLELARPGQIVVDLSTSAVSTTRELAAEFQKRGVKFADSPVARTRAAAEAGTLAVMVGAEQGTYDEICPLISTFATDIALCGPVGCGQVVKILNNMVLFETIVAFSEAKAIGERAGVDVEVLFNTLSKGSADSFALRNHGMKAVLPDNFPERAFSVQYARKDLTYALMLAEELHVNAKGARTVEYWFDKAIEQGLGEKYHPVISKMIGGTK